MHLDADTERGPENLADYLGTVPVGLLMQRSTKIANDVLFLRKPGHPLYREAIDQACRNIESGASNNVWEVTGPGIMTRLHKAFAAAALFDGLTVLPVREVKRWVRFRWQLDYKAGGDDWRQTGHGARSIYNA